MPSITLIVRNKVGLHARPAARFVQEARKFSSMIKVSNANCADANAKSILSVLALGVERNSPITIQAEGADAEQALEALKVLVEANLGEAE